MSEKIRLDVFMAEKKITDSREKARALIKNGQVLINGQPCTKTGFPVNIQNHKIEITGEQLRYVSRGGLKLEKALEKFNIDLKDKIAADIGASTGGFTDCMLKCGAKKVFAIDVGTNQLDKRLAEDDRVVNLEKTNIRYVTPDTLGELVDFASVDVSFISLKYVIPIVGNLLNQKGQAAALIKPQFEAGRSKLNKKGVVKDINVHYEVCLSIIEFIKDSGLYPTDFDFSPIKGPEGNIEYLVYMKKERTISLVSEDKIKETVRLSHSYFKGADN